MKTKKPNKQRDNTFVSVVSWAIVGALLTLVIWAVFLSPKTASGASASDYPLQVTVSIETDTSAADLTDYPVALEVNSLNLLTYGYMEAGAEDTFFTDSSNQEIAGTPQDVLTNAATWWFEVPFVASGSVAQQFLFMGNASAPVDHALGLYGASDTVDVPADASLDITADLTVEAQGLTLRTLPADAAYMLNKPGNYGLLVDSLSNVKFYAVSSTTTTDTLRPDGTGFATGGFGPLFCSVGWQCIDEGSADETGTYIQEDSAGSGTGYYTLTPLNLPDEALITQVDCWFRGRFQGTIGAGQCGLRLNGVDQINGGNQAFTASFADRAQLAVARPGGGAWQPSDLADIELIVRMSDGDGVGGNLVQVTQAYIVVTYNAAITASAPVVVGEEHGWKGTYDGVSVDLYKDDALVDSTPFTQSLAVSTDPIVVGQGDLYASTRRVRVGSVDVATPTWDLDLDFEPVDMAQTQVGTSGNGWTYLGTVDDLSTNNHPVTYSFERDQTGIVAALGGVAIAPNDFVFFSSTTTYDVLLVDGLPSFIATATATGDNDSLITGGLRKGCTNIGTMPCQAYWLLLTIGGSSLLVGGMTAFRDYSLTAAGIGASVVFVFVFALGDTFTAWDVAATVMMAISFISIHQFSKNG